eukprot:439856_1
MDEIITSIISNVTTILTNNKGETNKSQSPGTSQLSLQLLNECIKAIQLGSSTNDVSEQNNKQNSLEFDNYTEHKTSVVDSIDNNNGNNCETVNCVALYRLKQTMIKYHQLTQQNDIDAITKYFHTIIIEQVLEDYLHSLSKHNSDEHFEIICKDIGLSCDITSCVPFRRNHRNRSEYTLICIPSNAIFCQILDKIHCYYTHCFDIGYKIKLKELQYIEQIVDVETDENFINEFALKMKQTLFTRHKLFRTMKGINITNRYNINFNQTEVQSHNTNILYSFGHLYEYGPLGGEEEKEFADPKYIITKPKYKSLKEELTSNPFAVMNINQFNNELKKTTIHYKSKYWREYYQHWKKTTAFPKHYLPDTNYSEQ